MQTFSFQCYDNVQGLKFYYRMLKSQDNEWLKSLKLVNYPIHGFSVSCEPPWYFIVSDEWFMMVAVKIMLIMKISHSDWDVRVCHESSALSRVTCPEILVVCYIYCVLISVKQVLLGHKWFWIRMSASNVLSVHVCKYRQTSPSS